MGNRIFAVAATPSRRVRGGAHASVVAAFPADGPFSDRPAPRRDGFMPCSVARGGVVIPAPGNHSVIAVRRGNV